MLYTDGIASFLLEPPVRYSQSAGESFVGPAFPSARSRSPRSRVDRVGAVDHKGGLAGRARLPLYRSQERCKLSGVVGVSRRPLKHPVLGACYYLSVSRREENLLACLDLVFCNAVSGTCIFLFQ